MKITELCPLIKQAFEICDHNWSNFSRLNRTNQHLKSLSNFTYSLRRMIRRCNHNTFTLPETLNNIIRYYRDINVCTEREVAAYVDHFRLGEEIHQKFKIIHNWHHRHNPQSQIAIVFDNNNLEDNYIFRFREYNVCILSSIVFQSIFTSNTTNCFRRVLDTNLHRISNFYELPIMQLTHHFDFSIPFSNITDHVDSLSRRLESIFEINNIVDSPRENRLFTRDDFRAPRQSQRLNTELENEFINRTDEKENTSELINLLCKVTEIDKESYNLILDIIMTNLASKNITI